MNSSSRITTVTYRTSVYAVNSSYQTVATAYDYLDNPTPFQEYIYAGIEQENANNLETANVIIDDLQTETPEYSLKDTKIMNRLSSISKDLDDRWRGALFSLNPANPDATRRFCTSAREIFTEIFDNKAKDADVFAVFPKCDKTDKGNATRKSKIRYFLQHCRMDRPLKLFAREVKNQLHRKLPDCRFSITTTRPNYIDIALVSGKVQIDFPERTCRPNYLLIPILHDKRKTFSFLQNHPEYT